MVHCLYDRQHYKNVLETLYNYFKVSRSGLVCFVARIITDHLYTYHKYIAIKKRRRDHTKAARKRLKSKKSSMNIYKAVPTLSNEKIPNSSCKCVSPWQLWLKLCRWYNRKLSQFFAWLGEAVGLHPWITIAIALLVLGISASGIAFLKTENRTEELYVPKDSESVKNLDKARNYGFYRPSRQAEIIILQNGENILKEDCFKDALKLHKIVEAIPGYQEVCLPNIPSDPFARLNPCKREEPLWIFGYASNFTNLLTKLNRYSQTYRGLFRRVFGKGDYNDSTGEIKEAQALRMIYHIKGVDLGGDVSKKTADWEKEFLEKMESFDNLTCGSLVFTAERSIDDAISESTGSDIKFIALTFTLMINFSCFMLGKYLNPLTGHGLLAMSGIMCVAFGIVTGFGISMFAQIPFVSIAGILPFLIVGVGIDDMFIIVDELDRTHPNQTIPKRLSTVMRTVGPAITMTTMTDLLAFAVGTSSKFPSIIYFCTYAALSITFAFLFLVTIFVVYMSYDCKRMNAGRRDMVPCFKAPPPRPDAPRWDEPLPQTSNKIMEVWGKFLMKTPTKIVVVILSMCLLGVGIYGTTFVNEEFDRRALAKDGSEFIRYLDTSEEYYTTDIQVDLILEPGVTYSDHATQMKINNLTQIIKENKFYRPSVISWFSELQNWYKIQNSNETLLGSLNTFLKSNTQYRKDILFAEDNSTILASRLYCSLKGTSSSIELRDAMTTLRDDLKDKTTLPVFATSYPFIFFEQFVSTLPETVRNLSLAAAAILVVTSLFLVNPLVIFLVLLGFVSLIFELLGLMHVWGVSLNSISMINLVMAIGFAVDYSAHLAHSFVFSAQSTSEEKAIDALRTVGASVIMGGFSTFLGMVVTAFASSEIFRIFFKMFFGIVVLGLLHGLCFLPVWLSIICRHQIVIRPEQDVRTNPNSSSVRKDNGQDHGSANTNPVMSSQGNINGEVNSDSVEQSPSPQHVKSFQNSSEVVLADERAESSTSGNNSQSRDSRVKVNSDCHETQM